MVFIGGGLLYGMKGGLCWMGFVEGSRTDRLCLGLKCFLNYVGWGVLDATFDVEY